MTEQGTRDTVLATLTAATDAKGLLDWSVSVDSTIARAHQHATNTARLTGAGSNYKNPREEPADHGVNVGRILTPYRR